MPTKLICFAILLILFKANPCFAQNEKSNFSYSLRRLSDGKVIEKKDQEKLMPLASVSKLLSFNFALKVLGPDYKFQTKIYTNGTIDDHTLEGDIYLVGSGDPYLTAPHLVSLIHQIRFQGINKVKGNFYLDASKLPFTARISDLGLGDQADNPSLSALNSEFNRFTVLSNGKSLSPPLKHIRVKEKKLKQKTYYQLEKTDGNIEVWFKNKGKKHRRSKELPTRNSTLYTGELFRYLAQLHGLELPKPKEKVMEKKYQELAGHESLALGRLVALGIEYSNNLMAEIIMQTAVKKSGKDFDNLKEAATHMHQWLQNDIEPVDWDKIQIANGSGLSLHNLASSEQMSQFLYQVKDDHFNKRSFWSYLSINGHSGGISRRLKEPDLAFRVYAKTGSLNYVNNLSGHLIAKSGKKYAFSIFTQDNKKLQALENKHSNLAQRLRRGGSRWYYQSRKKIDGLLKKWIEKY